MNKRMPVVAAVLFFSVSYSIYFNLVNIQTFATSDFDLGNLYDEECADRMFDKYMKDSEPEFDKYMKDAEPEYDKYLDKANDVPLPDSESEVNDYLDSLDPLAEEYIDNLEPYADDYIDRLDPYAEDYIDNLQSCMN